jgi:hypothetical protein
MSDTVDELWQEYLAAETDRIRPIMMAALNRLIDELLALPEPEWHDWAKRLAASLADGRADVPTRMPLFRRVLLPALAAGVFEEEPGCARWLAHHKVLLAHADLSPLPNHLRTPDALLREAVRVDPSDGRARRCLVDGRASYLEYTLHELPAGVLYG